MGQKRKYPERIEGILEFSGKIHVHHMNGNIHEDAAKLSDFLHEGAPKDMKLEEFDHAKTEHRKDFARQIEKHGGFSVLFKNKGNISAIKLPRTKTELERDALIAVLGSYGKPIYDQLGRKVFSPKK
ncbi:hypothetical protein HY989_01125 [Candidatus Micrarchaeota archaeon]|nr:hypothetical protein [Candidatus Micrarchaeota archaeon]